MAIKIDIKNLPKAARIAIIVVPVVVCLGLFGYLSFYPKFKQINGLKQEISQQENDIVKSQSMAEKLDALKAENLKLKQRLQELEKQLPAEKEISILLTNVSNLGVQSGLTILTWKPSGRRGHPSGIVYEVPVSVTLKGSYHKLGIFFSKLTMLDRIVNISNIKLDAPMPKENEAVLSVSFSAVTFTAAQEGGISK